MVSDAGCVASDGALAAGATSEAKTVTLIAIVVVSRDTLHWSERSRAP
jgi:hypothetical protein